MSDLGVDDIREVTLCGMLDETLHAYREYARDSKKEETALPWVSGVAAFFRWLQHPVGVDADVGDRDEIPDEDVLHPLIDVEGHHIDSYLLWLAQSDYGLETKENYDLALNHFYEWSDRQDLGENVKEGFKLKDHNVKKGGIEKAREDAGHTSEDYLWIPRSDWRQMLEPENLPVPEFTSELILKLLWYTSMRCKALELLRVDRVYLDEGRITVKWLKSSDRADEFRDIIYPKDKLNPVLREWLDSERQKASPYAESSNRLLVTRKGGKMTSGYISSQVREAAHNAGIQEPVGTDAKGDTRWKVTGHTIRHSSLTWLANHGGEDGRGIPPQQLMTHSGHQDSQSIQRYIHRDDEKYKSTMQSAW